MTHETKTGRTELYRWAIGLSVAYVVDGILYTWTLIRGGYSGFAYGLVSLFPIFLPVCILGLAASRLYWLGLTQHGWTPRRAEWLFFFLCFNAVTAKVIARVDESAR